jgi:molybdopterin-containing oxidoreductase family iron-sulfur binding subunit
MVACPYGARRFNWGSPSLKKENFNPDIHYLGNRLRTRGVVEKCTFCIQRSREGKYPACVEVCPVGARKFGNLLNPDDEMRYLVENKRVYIFKEELNTKPKFYYFYGI